LTMHQFFAPQNAVNRTRTEVRDIVIDNSLRQFATTTPDDESRDDLTRT
jgi:hypothetical protein